MNINSPFVPQGATPPRGKSSFCFKVLMILAIHVVVIGGMLLQGCKDTKEQADDSNTPNSTNTGNIAGTNSKPETTPPVSITTQSNEQEAAGQPAGQPSASSQPVPPVQPPPTATPAVPPAPTTPSVDYVIARGDTLGAIAKKQHVSLSALMDANPGVNAKKLHIGQKLQIPGAATAAAPASGEVSAAEMTGADSPVYVVKSGDTLGKIARLHGTSYKKLMALNDLGTTSIRAGQKLKVPAPKSPGTEMIPTPGATAQPQPAVAPMPISTAAAAASPSKGVTD